MPSLLSNVTWVHQVMDVVENSLIDERVEVRSKAAQVLSGLLHCAFVDKPRHDSLLVRITTQFYMYGIGFLKGEWDLGAVKNYVDIQGGGGLVTVHVTQGRHNFSKTGGQPKNWGAEH